MIYSFAGCHLDTNRRGLTRDGQEVATEPQVFDVLCTLIESAGAVVTKDQLIETVWQGRIVSDASINSRINAARIAVGDNGKDQKVIRTLPRRGFELVANVEVRDQASGSSHPKPAQTIRYTAAPDGTNIAWAEAGSGAPLLHCWHHVSHLELDWSTSFLAPAFHNLASHHRLIRYDIRGTGLSDPLKKTDTLDAHVDDLFTVADAAGLDRFPIVAHLQGAAAAILAAARQPQRITRLVLVNGYARGRSAREAAPENIEHDPFIALLNSGGWGDPSHAFMRAFITMTLPTATHEEADEMIRLVGKASSGEDAFLQRKLIDYLDVTAQLPKVQCPTLVIHARLCAIHPVSEGRRLAAGIPDAEFLELDSSNAFFIPNEPVFGSYLQATLDFLGRD